MTTAKLSREVQHLLEYQALQIRIDSVRATTAAKSGHPTSCLSAADIVAALYFHILRWDMLNPKAVNNDRFILSKGHAIPVVYAALKGLGIISDDELLTLRRFDSELEGHPTPRFPYNEAATGSLGQGLSIGVGMALQAKCDGLSYRTYVMMGDAEIAEGSIWEAAEIAAHYQLTNLIGIVDVNRFGQSDEALHGIHAERYAKKFEAFGWHALVINGHDMKEIIYALTQAYAAVGQPWVIIAKTHKGHGISAVEDKLGFHGKPFKQEELPSVTRQLECTFVEAEKGRSLLKYVAPLPDPIKPSQEDALQFSPLILDVHHDVHIHQFAQDLRLSTRKAFGYGLVAAGKKNREIMVLDADVKNSTFTEFFEKDFPERFIQCFVAEQNMIGVAAGLQLRGKIPFAATFAAFFTRAHDQIRMAAIGRVALRLCGSHVGVSIGEDGPSQMGLEDIAMMRALPASVVLYPSDAVAAYKLVGEMVNYHDGISYLRTTRADTPIIYQLDEEFVVGGCKVLHMSPNDRLCIIAAGITLHESLKAYKLLKAEGIDVSVIDLYSIKPLDVETLRRVAAASHGCVVTVEDHYIAGGLGEAVAHALVNDAIEVHVMAVAQISRSGTPEELMEYAGIDAQSIVARVMSLL